MTSLALRFQWVDRKPSFLYVTLLFTFFITLITYRYLHRQTHGASFVQWYLFFTAVKLIAYLGYNVFLVLNDRLAAVANVLFFLVVYFAFTAIEIAFLYCHVNRENRP
jgi:hypothetical protein